MYHSCNELLELKHKRKTIVLYGCGKVGTEIIKQRYKKNSGPHIRLLCVSRKKKLTEKSDSSDKKRRSDNVLSMALDLDERKNIKRIASLGSMIIVLIPTMDSNNSLRGQEKDSRTRLLAIELSKKEAAQKKGVYLSTTGVYGDKNGKKINETSKCIPKNKRSLRRLDAENKVRKLNFHVLRVPGIYSINRLPLSRLLKKTPVLNNEEDIYTNHIHEKDLARTAYLALFRGKRSRVTNVVDNSELKMSEYMDLIASAIGIEKPVRASIFELTKLAEKGLISEMAMSFLNESRRVDNKRLQEELKVNLNYPTVDKFIKTNKKQLSTIRQQTPVQ